MIEKVQGNHGHQGTGEIPPGFGIQGAAQEGISAELVQQVADIISGKSVDVNVVDQIIDDIVAQLSVPELDEANAVALGVDLALLAALMKINGEKYKAQIDKALIDKQNSDIDAQTKERLAKLDETLKQMDKAAKMNAFMKVFGWLMVAVSIAIAAVTCGAAGGLVVGAVLSAAVALTFQVLNETGVMEKFTKAVADLLKKMGVDDKTAEIVAAVFVAVFEIALSLLTGKIGGKLAAKANKIFKAAMDAGLKAGLTAEQAYAKAMAAVAKHTIMRTMKMATMALARILGSGEKALKIAKWVFEGVMQALGIAGQAGSSATNFNYMMAKSEETLSKAQLKHLMKVLDEMMEALEQIMQQLMSGDSDIAKLLLTTDDTLRDMSRRIPLSMA